MWRFELERRRTEPGPCMALYPWRIAVLSCRLAESLGGSRAREENAVGQMNYMRRFVISWMLEMSTPISPRPVGSVLDLRLHRLDSQARGSAAVDVFVQTGGRFRLRVSDSSMPRSNLRWGGTHTQTPHSRPAVARSE